MEHGELFDFAVVAMDKDNPRCWVYMPDILSRIEQFCETYQTDMDGKFVAEQYKRAFVSDDPMFFALAILQGERLVGHWLSAITDWGGRAFITILQHEADLRLPEGLDKLAISASSEWRRHALERHGAEHIQAFVAHPKLIRHFGKIGFKTKYAIMRLDIE